MIEPTLSHAEAANQPWDVLILGAGIAGCSAAIQTSRLGLRTLLVEAKAFPRDKVCGGCLNQRAQASLRLLGLTEPLMELGACEIQRLSLITPRRSVDWKLPTLVSVGRANLDAMMVRHAIRSGAHFLPQTVAKVTGMNADEEPSKTVNEKGFATLRQAGQSFRSVELRWAGGTVLVQGKCVLAADGLTRSSQSSMGLESQVASGARIGVQAIFSHDRWNSPRDRLTMAIGRSGYVGISAIEEDRWDLAAAIDPKLLSSGTRPADLVERVLDECKLPAIQQIRQMSWLATPALTRHTRQKGEYRLFLIGDAIGYIEPFTGEGMAWALRSSQLVVPLVQQACAQWNDQLVEEWNNQLTKQIQRHQWMCRALSQATRMPRLASWLIGICDRISPLREALIGGVVR